MKLLRNMVLRLNQWKIRFFLLSLFAGALPFFLQPVYFMEPDDYLLNYIANGSYGFEGSQNLVFLKFPLGLLLKGLYKLPAQVNWYAVLLAVFFVLACAVIYDCIWACTGSYLGILIFFLPNLVLIRCFFTFTVAGYLAVLAGGLLVCTTVILQKGLPFRIAAILFLYFGYCMRNDTLIPVLFILFPLGLYDLSLHDGWKHLWSTVRKQWKVWRFPVVLLLGLFVFTFIGEKISYRDPVWREYLTFTNARGYAVDYPALTYAYHIGEFEEARIDEIDYYMLTGWNFAQKDVFPPEKMNAAGRIEARNVSLSTRKNYAKGQLSDRKNQLLILFPVLTFLLLCLIQKGYPWFCGLCIVGCDLFLDAVLLVWRMRFVARAATPLALTAIAGLILLGCKKTYRNRIFAIAGILVLVLLPGYRYTRAFLDSVKWMRQPYGMKAHSGIRKEISAHPENLYIFDAAILSSVYYYDHPVSEVTTTDTFQNITRSGSWDTFSLRYYNQAKRFLSDPDHLLTSLGDEHVYYVSYDASVPKTKTFLEYHTGKTYELTSLEYDDSQFEIYKFQEKE